MKIKSSRQTTSKRCSSTKLTNYRIKKVSTATSSKKQPAVKIIRHSDQNTFTTIYTGASPEAIGLDAPATKFLGSTKISKLVIGSPVQRSVKAIVRSIDTFHIDPYLMLSKSSKGCARVISTNNHDIQPAAQRYSVVEDKNDETKEVDDSKKSPECDQEGKSGIVTSDIHDQVIITNVSDDKKLLNKTEDVAKGGRVQNLNKTFDDGYENETFDSPTSSDKKHNNAAIANKSPSRATAKAPPAMLLSLQHQVKTINLKLAETEPKSTKSKLAVQRPLLNSVGSKQSFSATNRPETQNSNEKSPCKHTSSYNREEAREYMKKQQAKRKLEMGNKGGDQGEIIKERLNALKNVQRELVKANVTKRNKKNSQKLKHSKNEPALRQNIGPKSKDSNTTNQNETFIPIDDLKNIQHDKIAPISKVKPAQPLGHGVAAAVNENAASSIGTNKNNDKHLQKQNKTKQTVELAGQIDNEQMGRIGFIRKKISGHDDVFSPLQLHEATMQLENTFNQSRNITNLEDVSEYLINITDIDRNHDFPNASQLNLNNKLNSGIKNADLSFKLNEQATNVSQQALFLEEIQRQSLVSSRTGSPKPVQVPGQQRLLPLKAKTELNPTFSPRSFNKSLAQKNILNTSPNRDVLKKLEFDTKSSSPPLMVSKNNSAVSMSERRLEEAPSIQNKVKDQPPIPTWLQETNVKNYPYNFLTALHNKIQNVTKQKQHSNITMQRQHMEPVPNLLSQAKNEEGPEYDSSSFTNVLSGSKTSHSFSGDGEVSKKIFKRMATSSSAEDSITDDNVAKNKWNAMNKTKTIQPQLALGQISHSTVIDPNTISELSSIKSDTTSDVGSGSLKLNANVSDNDNKNAQQPIIISDVAVQSRDPHTIGDDEKNVNESVCKNALGTLNDRFSDKSRIHFGDTEPTRLPRGSHRLNKVSGATDNNDNDKLIVNNQLYLDEVVAKDIHKKQNSISSSSLGHRPLIEQQKQLSGIKQIPQLPPAQPISDDNPLSSKSDDVIARGQQFYCKMNINRTGHMNDYDKMFNEFKMSLTNFIASNQKLKLQEEQTMKTLHITTQRSSPESLATDLNKYSSAFEPVESPLKIHSLSRHSSSATKSKLSDESYGIYEPQKFEDFLNSNSKHSLKTSQDLSIKSNNEVDEINESIKDELSQNKPELIEESVKSVSEYVDENVNSSPVKPAQLSINDSNKQQQDSDPIVEKRSTEDISSLISDVVPVEILINHDKTNTKLNANSSISSLVSMNLELDKIILKGNNCKANSLTITDSNSVSSDIKEQLNLKKANVEFQHESEITSVIETYESDFDKYKSSSATNKENMWTVDESSIHELSFNGVDSGQKGQLNFSTVGMVDQMIYTNTMKSEQIAAIVGARSKAVVDRLKCQIAFLEIQKQKLKQQDNVKHVPEIQSIKKKQRAILMKLEHIKNSLKKIIQAPIDDKGQRAKKIFEFLSHGNYASAMKLHEKGVESPQRRQFNNRNVANQRGPIKVYELDHNQLLEKLLMKRELELRKRREKLERLLKWKAHLDQEEEHLKQLEKELADKSSKVSIENIKTSEPKSTATENSDSNVLSNAIEIDRLSQIESSITKLQEVNDDEDVVTLSGAKLNKLWFRLCGRYQNKYDSSKMYELNKRDVENIYEEAKLVVIGNFQNKNYVNQMLEKTQAEHSSGTTFSQSHNNLSTQSTSASNGKLKEFDGIQVAPSMLVEINSNQAEERSVSEHSINSSNALDEVVENVAKVDITVAVEESQEEESKSIKECLPNFETKEILTVLEESSVSSQEQKHISIGSSDEGDFYFEDQELNRSLSEETIEGKDDAEKTHIELSFHDSLSHQSNHHHEVDVLSDLFDTANETKEQEVKDPELKEVDEIKKSDKDDESDVSYSDTFDKVSKISGDDLVSNNAYNKTLEQSITSTDNEKSIPEVLESIEGSAISEQLIESSSDTPVIRDLPQTTDLDKQDDQANFDADTELPTFSSKELASSTQRPSTYKENFVDQIRTIADNKTMTSSPNDYKLPDIISEAEVLRIQQMQIEQEIEQLQQQVPLSFQIPNKPPPPYTLRLEETDANQFPSREIVHKLVMQRVETLYNTNRASGSSIRDPVEGSTANIYERIIIDMAEEMFYSFERCLEIEKHAGVVKNSLAFFDPPNELDCLKENAVQKVDKICSPILDVQLEVELISAKLNTEKKKRDFVDEILISELASEDSNWSYFDAEEKIVKNDLVNIILKQLVHEAVHDILQVL